MNYLIAFLIGAAIILIISQFIKGDVNNGKRFKGNNWLIYKMGKGKRCERFFR